MLEFSDLPILYRFNAARGFVGGATFSGEIVESDKLRFQCRTRLCGWCNRLTGNNSRHYYWFQCRTRLCGWCNIALARDHRQHIHVSMPHAALWVVQPTGVFMMDPIEEFQCRTRLCGWCNRIARSPCPPRGKKLFWKVSGNLSVLTENM